MAKKSSVSFKTLNGQKLFVLKISTPHLEEIKHNPKFIVDMKKGEVKSDIFDNMFHNPSNIQTLTWSQYTCSLCGKLESFLVDNSKVYCVGCYSIYVNKEAKTSASFIDTLSTGVSTVDLYQSISTNEKSSKRKRQEEPIATTSIIDEIDDLIGSETNHHSRMMKFQQKMQLSQQLKENTTKQNVEIILNKKDEKPKVKVFYNITCLNDIINKLQSFQSSITELGEKYGVDIFYNYELLQTIKPNIKSLKKQFNIQNQLPKNLGEFLQSFETSDYKQYKQMYQNFNFVQNSNKFFVLNLEEQHNLTFIDECNCQICSNYLNGNHQFIKVNESDDCVLIDNTLKICNDCNDLSNKYSLLEIFALNILENKKLNFSLISIYHIIKQYDELYKKVISAIETSSFQYIQQEYLTYYQIHLNDILTELGFDKELSVLKLQEVKYIYEQLVKKVS